ncbi:SGNH hydrolase-type esterase domain-containing protein [Choanephora cucurbitarum]|nr:SGNH hydrolase-type esterase domain-containing protein [Choanephora cucurbitarum]
MTYSYDSITPYQVLQRDLDKNSVSVRLEGHDLQQFDVGGPHYYFDDQRAKPFYVGDIWVMAGGDNMEGLGDMFDIFTFKTLNEPVYHDKAFLYNFLEEWQIFTEDPSHDSALSPRTVHQGFPNFNATLSPIHANVGASLAPAFVNRFKELCPELPIGLIACAQVHSTSADWDPTSKDPDTSLYGAMLDKIKKVDGRIAGVLWYQGESDIKDTSKAENYGAFFQKWISELRKDIDQPNLPVVFVQMGPHSIQSPISRENWKKIQNDQFKMFGQSPYTAGVASLDAMQDISYNLSTAGLSLVGRRLALAADKVMKGQGESATPLPFEAYRQRHTQYIDSNPIDIMSVVLAFKHLTSPWDLRDGQPVIGFSYGKSETPIVKAFVACVTSGSVRLYLPEVIDGPLMLHYGMQPRQANLITKDGRALPAFQNFQV